MFLSDSILFCKSTQVLASWWDLVEKIFEHQKIRKKILTE